MYVGRYVRTYVYACMYVCIYSTVKKYFLFLFTLLTTQAGAVVIF